MHTVAFFLHGCFKLQHVARETFSRSITSQFGLTDRVKFKTEFITQSAGTLQLPVGIRVWSHSGYKNDIQNYLNPPSGNFACTEHLECFRLDATYHSHKNIYSYVHEILQKMDLFSIPQSKTIETKCFRNAGDFLCLSHLILMSLLTAKFSKAGKYSSTLSFDIVLYCGWSYGSCRKL